MSKAYTNKVRIVNVVTAPEIEMLIIHNENKYTHYKFPGMKPSEYCKVELNYHNVKSEAFVTKYFADVDVLVAAIYEHKRVANIQRNEIALADILK